MTYLKAWQNSSRNFSASVLRKERDRFFFNRTDQCQVQNERLGVKSIFDFSIESLRPLPYKTPSIVLPRRHRTS